MPRVLSRIPPPTSAPSLLHLAELVHTSGALPPPWAGARMHGAPPLGPAPCAPPRRAPLPPSSQAGRGTPRCRSPASTLTAQTPSPARASAATLQRSA
eukprot:358448-Chlamydomonas_euryale.AAC.2